MLPKLLDAIGFRRGILVGHTDGASIAASYAGSDAGPSRTRASSLIAPHFFVEDISVRSIAEIKHDLRDDRPARKAGALAHADVDTAFRGWNGAWLDPGFRDWDIPRRSPISACRCWSCRATADQYGTLRAGRVAQEECYCPVEDR